MNRNRIVRIRLVCLILTLFLPVMLLGCNEAITASEALGAAKAFIDALQLLQDASKLYNSYVSDAVTSTKTKLSPPADNPDVKIDLPQIALDWEQKWNKVSGQLEELERKFNDVGKASDAYWEKLNQVTDAIQDTTLREREKKKNQEAKQKWDEAYQNAQKQLDAAKALRDKGNDLKNVMIAAALRRQLAEYTSTLDQIAKETENLLNALDTLTAQGREIVNLNQ